SVQSSTLFSHGAIKILNALKIDSLSFGSESGNINNFINNFDILNNKEHEYNHILKQQLHKGLSYPVASNMAYKTIGFKLDVLEPNNILGFSYTKEILSKNLPIELYTFKRTNNAYHDEILQNKISSATSIRKEVLNFGLTQNVKNTLPISTIKELDNYKILQNKISSAESIRQEVLNFGLTQNVKNSLPISTIKELDNYKKNTDTFHQWENYFDLLQYKVLSSSRFELSKIALIDEGIHNRIKDTARKATSFHHWMHLVKTKRYTWVKIQRIFTHILTSTTQSELDLFHKNFNQVRLLGMNKTGQTYLNKIKNSLDIQIVSSLKSFGEDSLETKVSDVYYTAVNPHFRKQLINQEYAPPIILNKNS